MPDDDQTVRGDIVRTILVARNRTIVLDVDLAELYDVTTAALNQAVMIITGYGSIPIIPILF